MPHVISQRWREHSDECSRRINLGVVEGEVGDPVKRDRRLARTGRSANGEKARCRPRDQVELLGVDQTRNFWQVLVGTARVAWSAELWRMAVGIAGCAERSLRLRRARVFRARCGSIRRFVSNRQ